MSGEDIRIRPDRIRSTSAQRAGGLVSRKKAIGPNHRSWFGPGQRASVQANRLITSRSCGAVVKARVVRHGRRHAPHPDHQPNEFHALKVGRLRKLESLGLANQIGPGRWAMSENAEVTLRELGKRGDIIKRIHRGLAEQGIERGAANYVLAGESLWTIPSSAGWSPVASTTS